MQFRNLPIRKKLMTVILLTSGAVLLLVCSSFLAYEFFTFRQQMVRQITTLSEIIAKNSTAALAFESQQEAEEILAALKADKHITAAALYDKHQKLFAHYPADLDTTKLPQKISTSGFIFYETELAGFQPVVVGEKSLGTLYIRSDLGAFGERLLLYASISIIVIVAAAIMAFLISSSLQRSISDPLLQLTATAERISNQNDYSVRAPKQVGGEVSTLTDAFNNMLEEIHQQSQRLSESGDRMRAVLNAAMSAVVVIDRDGRITDWNGRAEIIFGWSRDEVIGKVLTETIIPPNHRLAHSRGIQHYFKTGEGPVLDKVIEITALRRNGEIFPVDLSVSALKTEDTILFCGFITDITERKEAEARLLEFNQELERMVKDRTTELELANKELEAFSYSVSHDLRAPLRSIHGYMNIFSEDYASNLDGEARRIMNIILTNAKRMGQLIDDLLAFSKLGRKELVKTNLPMNDLAINVWEDLKKAETGRSIELVSHPVPDAYGDATTMKQVWINLLSNAIKYTRRCDHAVVEIGSEDDGDMKKYYVRDNGAGFDMQFYDKLFGVFQRLHSNSEFEGTGVGLAIVQRIIQKHGGSIWAESKMNEGTTFYFTLPSFNHQPKSSGDSA
jgi:PAS domain S-box-containing protein